MKKLSFWTASFLCSMYTISCYARFGGDIAMKKYKVLFLICFTLLLVACADEKVSVKKDVTMSAVNEQEYEELGTVQLDEKPAREALQKVSLSLTIENFEQLQNAKLAVDDNARALFGKSYWFGSYTLNEHHYEAVFYVQLDKETIQQQLEDINYKVTWEYRGDTKQQVGDFGAKK